MKKVRITVLKTTLDKELANEYGIEGLTACPMLKAGILCGLCQAGRALRRSLESHLPVRIRSSTWRWRGPLLLWRLDSQAGGSHL